MHMNRWMSCQLGLTWDEVRTRTFHIIKDTFIYLPFTLFISNYVLAEITLVKEKNMSVLT